MSTESPYVTRAEFDALSQRLAIAERLAKVALELIVVTYNEPHGLRASMNNDFIELAEDMSENLDTIQEAIDKVKESR